MMDAATDTFVPLSGGGIGNLETEESIHLQPGQVAAGTYVESYFSEAATNTVDNAGAVPGAIDSPQQPAAAPAAPVGGPPRPALQKDVQRMRDTGGFTAGQINRFIDLQRKYWYAAGLTDEQIDNYYGIKPFNISDISDFFENSARTLWGYGRTDVPSLDQYLKAGWRTSDTDLAYLLWTHQHPEDVAIPDDSPILQSIIQGIGQTAGDAPVMAVGYVAGGGLFNPVLGAGGAMALPAGLRVALLNAYNGGQIDNFDDFWKLAKAIGIETLKGEALGIATMGIAGPLAKIATGEANIANATASRLLKSTTARAAARVVQGPAAVGTQALVDFDFDDKFDAKDLINSSVMLLGIHLTRMGVGNLKGLYRRMGLGDSLEAYGEAAKDLNASPPSKNGRGEIAEPDFFPNEFPSAVKDRQLAGGRNPGAVQEMPESERQTNQLADETRQVKDVRTSFQNNIAQINLERADAFRAATASIDDRLRGASVSPTQSSNVLKSGFTDPAILQQPLMDIRATGAFLRAAQRALGELYVKHGISPFKGVKILASRTGEIAKAAGPKITYQTYTKKHRFKNQVYSGRTSGAGSPEENVRRRDASHHKSKDEFHPAVLDRSTDNPKAAIGREQWLIEKHGGAQSQDGTSANKIRAISARNPKGEEYRRAQEEEFGRQNKFNDMAARKTEDEIDEESSGKINVEGESQKRLQKKEFGK